MRNRPARRGTWLAGAALAVAALFASPPTGPFAQEAELESPEALADRIVAFLDTVETLSGTYSQISTDGQRASGIFDFEFPSKMHFAELEPTRNRLISDGTWIASVEEDTGRAVRYPISATPFEALLTGGLGDRSAYEIVDSQSQREGDGWRHFLSISVIEEEALGDLTLLFREPPLQLEGWIIRDAQGQATLVRLSTERFNEPIDPNRFRIHMFERAPG